MNREAVWARVLILGAAIVLGRALFSLNLDDFGNAVLLTLGCLLAAVASSLQVPIEPGARISLAPVVVLVLSQALGYEAALIAAWFSGIFPFGGRKTIREALLRSAETSLAFAISGLITNYITIPAGAGARMTILTMLYLGMLYIFDLVRISLREAVKISRLLSLLGRTTFPHYGFLFIASVLGFWTYRTLGLFGAFLALIVLMEVYYPIKLLADQRALFHTSLQMISQAVDIKDPYTSKHSQRVSRYATWIARAMGLPESEVQRVRLAGLLHDIGKIGVLSRIIRKPAALDESEMATMKKHAEIGAEIIEGLDVLGDTAEIIRHSHESFDGTGYPLGLQGAEIPLGSRIVLVADTYDSLVGDRPYRKGRSPQEALAVLDSHTGRQFDPTAVSALKAVLRRIT